MCHNAGTRAAISCTIMDGIQPDRDPQILVKVTLPRRRNTNIRLGIRKAQLHRLHPPADGIPRHERGPPMAMKLILSTSQHPKGNNCGIRRKDHVRADGTLLQNSPDNPLEARAMPAITTLNNRKKTTSKHHRLLIH